MERKKQVALIVLDGWGWSESSENNAIVEANTPFFDHLWKIYPHTFLHASEGHVGLPEGQIGNSEIGHMTIGAGKTIDNDLVRISKAIQNKEIAANAAIARAFQHVKKHSSTLHFVGLVSPGGVHSHQDHLFALLDEAKKAGVENMYIHAITDGRDTLPQSASAYLAELENVLAELGVGKIASVSGRLYAMDRDNNWDRVEKVERAIFHGEGIQGVDQPSAALKKLYGEGAVDEHLLPMVFSDANPQTISLHDSVIFFNFRADRGRMLSRKIFERAEEFDLEFVTLTQYDASFGALVAFPPQLIETTLAQEVSKGGLTQAHVAETEKYPHATYFLNGGREKPYEGEEHVLVPSRKDILTHDQAPEMRAKEIADEAINRINAGVDFLFVNFANADMVGHTANKSAIITAVETLDRELQRVCEVLLARGGKIVLTADHGNAELNIDPASGENHTAHTMNVVPCIVTEEGSGLRGGTLADIAPTVLELLELPKPSAMTGNSLLEK
jgi:2,3-bisphosphoglycerate-independent phosphoglycerate mutase